MSRIFLYKENTDDRDCVAYIDIEDLQNNYLCVDNHFNIEGACYSKSLRNDFEYEDIVTVLTEEEIKTLINPIGKNLTTIIEKLQSKENQDLFNQIIEEEKEYLMDEYNLSEYDMKKIFEKYYLEYRDRGIISCIFANAYDCGYEEAWSCGYIENGNTVQERYFDFERLGQDLADQDEKYLELDDGRIVVLNY